MDALILLGLFFLLIVIKVPIAISMLLTAFAGVLTLGVAPLSMVGQAAFNSVFSYTLLAIPFYVLAGNIMTKGAISAKLCNLVRPFLGRFTGGLGMVTVVASTFFGAISGSSVATTAAIGSMMTPEMEKSGMSREYGLAVSAASGVIGPIIPPSIGFILYGVATNTSIGDLFLAGIVPGILFAVFLCLMIYITAKQKGFTNKDSRQEGGAKGYLKVVWRAKWAILMPVVILGGIYSGIFTPTEAGAVACIYGIVVTMFIEREMNLRELLSVLRDSAKTAATILFITGCAGVLAKVFTLAQVPQHLSEAITSIAHTKFQLLLLINILLLFLGCVMDGTANIIIMSPLLLPVVQSMGVDPVHFGMTLCINVGIGAITPPVGCCLFTASVIGKAPLEKICNEIWPFIAAEALALVLINCVPMLSTGLVTLFH